MGQSILVYTFIISVMLLLASIAQKRSLINNIYNSEKAKFLYPEIILMILVFTIMFGMRYNVGTDYLSYLSIYNYSIDEKALRYEPLFRYISTLCSDLNVHPTIYFGIWAFIQITFFLLAFNNKFYLLPLLVFFLFFNQEFMFWMNGIRQALAMCIWLYSVKYIHENKLFNYLLWITLAALFHKSVIILVIFYPILNKGIDYFKSIFMQIILFASTFIVRNAFSTVLSKLENIIIQFQYLFNSYESYTIDNMLDDLNNEVIGSGLAYIYKTIIWILIILYSKRLKRFYRFSDFNIVYFLFFIGILAEYSIPTGMVLFSRPFRYLYIFKTIMLAYFVYYLLKDKSTKYNKVLALIIIISFIAIFYLYQVNLPTDNTSWYRFYFQEI